MSIKKTLDLNISNKILYKELQRRAVPSRNIEKSTEAILWKELKKYKI